MASVQTGNNDSRAAERWGATLVVLLVVAGYLFFNYENLYFDLSLLLGLLFSPYIVRRANAEKSRRLLPVVILLGGWLLFRRSSSLFYFFCGFSVMYVLETNWGKLNQLPFFLLALASALAGHTAYIWSFPIRLQLSDWAAQVLSHAGWKAIAEGNIILLNGREFSVDPACMGLHLLTTAGILALLLMAHVERRHSYTFGFFRTASYLAVVLLLAVLANFTRLLALLVFQVSPGSPAHDLIGLLSLAVYVLLPFYLWLNYGIKMWRDSPAIRKETGENGLSRWAGWPTYLILLVLLAVNGAKLRKPISVDDVSLEQLSLPGFKSAIVAEGILKLGNESVLIYIKAPANPIQGAHDPRICWQGTGYEFTHIRKQEISGVQIYTARLEKDGAGLYTAWWFDDGRQRTTDDWRWRWLTLTADRRFRLVNLTTLRETDLEREVVSFWKAYSMALSGG